MRGRLPEKYAEGLSLRCAYAAALLADAGVPEASKDYVMHEISSLLDRIDDGRTVVASFQRGWVWKAEAVRSLMDSLYRGYPIGSIIVWPRRMGSAEESVIDGQQRLTALYGVIRGRPPAWLDSAEVPALSGLRFDLEEERFEHVSAGKLPSATSVDVSRLFSEGTEWWLRELEESTIDASKRAEYLVRVLKLLSIKDRPVPLESLPQHMEPEHAERVFEIVNTAGTRVNRGDLTLGQLSLSWSGARNSVETQCDAWKEAGYQVKIDWFLHAMAGIVSDRIDFKRLFGRSRQELENACDAVRFSMDSTLNLLQQYLGFDPRVKLAINNGLIPVVIYRAKSTSSSAELAREEPALLAWWMYGNLAERWSRDTRNRTNSDLSTALAGGSSALLRSLSDEIGGLRVKPNQLTVSYKMKRYSQLLYSVTRCRGGLDLRTGLALSPTLVGPLQGLQAHHIFPRKYLRDNGIEQREIDQLANVAYISQGSNLRIGSKAPTAYLGALEASHLGVLASQWIPDDPALWQARRYKDFLAARREMVASAADDLLTGLAGTARPSTASR